MTGFTLEWAIEYLDTLRGSQLSKAREYIEKAPKRLRHHSESRSDSGDGSTADRQRADLRDLHAERCDRSPGKDSLLTLDMNP